ncbi:hypothetical protein PXD04_10310 [Methanosphaera sp. ISO3-F5]|uniref:hypothetical protein n=1 Tax=Methanosphaera sp. ISO3-F5 TaxID=1452353 RepID=UPI002B2587F0|nr:hypothetical protein [Methanosphaera sp. ISO3-F5]WQH64083.1 hypothetical protein PXD04_10310 [Methanosphaera sp. ISO3-F5]
MQTILKTLNSVGLNTVWSYLKPFKVLSNGEKMRAELAKVLLEDETISIFDEFTSVVDRTIAKTTSLAVSKAIKRSDKKIILISCHEDIIEYLQPDWIFNTDTFTFQENTVKKNQHSNYKYTQSHTNIIKNYGKCLVNITI